MDKKELLELLKENLKVEMKFGRAYDPNALVVKLLFDDEVISESDVWISIRPEYEG